MIQTFESFGKLSAMDELVAALVDELEARSNVKLSLFHDKFYNGLILSKILVNKERRQEGVGSAVMRDICAFADTHALPIALTPSPDFGGTKSRLVRFYRSFGFKPYKGYEVRETMVREPSS